MISITTTVLALIAASHASPTPEGWEILAPRFLAKVNPYDVAGPYIAKETAPEVQRLFDKLASCPALPPRKSPPIHVNDVRPDDISVVIGMGDSVIAGLNTRYLYNDVFKDEKFRGDMPHEEFRGTNFLNGNDTDTLSVAKIISILRKKQGRNEVDGLANGHTPLSMCFGPVCPAGTALSPFMPQICGLNAAQPGSIVTKHNIDNQFKYLDQYYSSFTPKQSSEPWKMVVYDPGFNNLCLACNPLWNSSLNGDAYEANVRYLIEQTRKRYKNTIVTLIGPSDLTQLQKLLKKDPVCGSIHSGSVEPCFCLFFKPEITGPQITALSRDYNARLIKIAKEYKSKGYTDFAVKYDPGLVKMDILDMPIPANLAGVDCYHPSVSAHSRHAVNFFKNMLVPDAKKTAYSYVLDIDFKCPTIHDRISIE